MKDLTALAIIALLFPAQATIRDTARKRNNRIRLNRSSPLVPVSYATGQERNLNTEDYAPLRLLFKTDELENAFEGKDNATIAKGNAIINEVLPRVETLFTNSLSVVPVPNLVIPGNICRGYFEVPTAWTQVVQGLPDTDLLVFVSAWSEIGQQQVCNTDDSKEVLSTLAVSTACAVDPATDRPVVGFANLCLNEIATTKNGTVDQASVDMMVDVLIHELLHVLGLDSDLFKYFRNSATGEPLTPRKATWMGSEAGFEKVESVSCVGGQAPQQLATACNNTLMYHREEVSLGVDKVRRSYYEIVLPTVVQVSRNQFNCQDLNGVRLENQPTSEDCFGSHFDERTWYAELLSAVYDESARGYLTPLTLAFLEDTGWYKSNFSQSRNSPFGLGAGCDFVEEDCLVDGNIPDHNKGYFCNDTRKEEEKDWMCGPTHDYKGKCDLENYQYPQRTYMTPFHIGPEKFLHADFCPMVVSDTLECGDDTAVKLFPDVEKFGNESKCMGVSVNNTTNSAVCMRTSCNNENESFDFEVQGTIYHCMKSFEEVSIGANGTDYVFHCPRLSQVCPDMYCPSMCSGKGICDWSLERPRCKCFDRWDTTPGCFDSKPLEADVCPYAKQGLDEFASSSSKTFFSLILSFPLLLAFTMPYIL